MILPERVFGSSGDDHDLRAAWRSHRSPWRRGRAGPSTSSAPRPPRPVRRRARSRTRTMRLSGGRVGGADHGRLGDRRVRHQRRLDLGGRDAVAGDVHDVVDAAEQPEVAVARPSSRRPRRSTALLVEAGPVRLLVAARRRPRSPRSIAGHGCGEHEVAAAAVAAPTCRRCRRRRRRCRASGRIAEPGLVAVTPGSGLIMIAPVSVCHHVSTIGQRSPPMMLRYQIHASGLIGSPTEPSTPQRGQVVLGRDAPRPTS